MKKRLHKGRLALIIVLFAALVALVLALASRWKQYKGGTSGGGVTGSAVDADGGDGGPAGSSGALDAGTGTGDSDLSSLGSDMAEQMVSGIMDLLFERMSPELAGQMTEEDIRSSWEGETEGLQGYQGIETVVEKREEGAETVTVTIRYEENSGCKIKFEFNENNRVAGVWIERVELPPLSGTESGGEAGSISYEETEFAVGRSPYELSGSLTIPGSGGKVPAVLILSGADDSDMDGTVGLAGNTPFRDIAYGLASHGIASLRYNRRGFQYPEQTSSSAGLYDSFLQDAWYALDGLYNDGRIDRNRIFVLGHGSAADALPAFIKKKEKRLAGAVMLAGRPVAVKEHYYGNTEKNIAFDAKYLIDENSLLPLLILQGEADFETGLEEFRQWRTVLEGRSHTECHSFKKLNHYFMETEGKQDKTDYDKAKKVSSTVIDKIVKWCLEQKNK